MSNKEFQGCRHMVRLRSAVLFRVDAVSMDNCSSSCESVEQIEIGA